jgi:hypothetical protein
VLTQEGYSQTWILVRCWCEKHVPGIRPKGGKPVRELWSRFRSKTVVFWQSHQKQGAHSCSLCSAVLKDTLTLTGAQVACAVPHKFISSSLYITWPGVFSHLSEGIRVYAMCFSGVVVVVVGDHQNKMLLGKGFQKCKLSSQRWLSLR